MRIFFCKQKTAYEMRISDWSSDVCSSDLKTYWRLTWALPLPFFLAVMIDGVVARALQLKLKSLAVGACLALGALFVAFGSRSGTLLCATSVALGPQDLKVPPAEYDVARHLDGPVQAKGTVRSHTAGPRCTRHSARTTP